MKDNDQVVYLNGIQIGTIDFLEGSDIRTVATDVKPEVLCDLVLSNELLYNEIQVRLKNWTEN